ncbi:hypothetical protein KNU39_gp64 [Gordonia phage Mutzi]|uniref:Uncharacterized protein n=1 Tax=Gordonia phage Mutzi TaxID=2500789 RepID=A0A411AXS5_9CAUD|nr:hypothetical protein KNU39_gp64 [Gordonia phage Mutzi]QAX92875.1 hypothetical protein SEA_MUTZI_64 [Gordonia phage Mutzi]QWY84751.1 hypothetical protein SEA_YUNGMONEY_65 [Gordonia phage YungMoney]
MSEQLTEGPLAKMFGPKPAAERPVDDRIRDLELRLDAVRAQRDAAVQQSLDHAATIAVLRRKLDQRADRIGYCDSTFTPPDGGDTLTCALDAGHRANLHRDASLRYAWDDNAKPPVVDCGATTHMDSTGTDHRCHLPAGHVGQHHDPRVIQGDREHGAPIVKDTRWGAQ